MLIDCPPVEIVADTQIIEKLADRTIFVVRSGLMQRSMLGDIEQIYKDKKFKNMSLIQNGTKAQVGRSLRPLLSLWLPLWLWLRLSLRLRQECGGTEASGILDLKNR